jgi:thiol-disulfide isomerase/thioredoxin
MTQYSRFIIKLMALALLLLRHGEVRAEMRAAPVELAQYVIRDATGGQFTLGSFRGKVVLVEFWASWCSRCRAQISEIKALRETFETGFETVAVNLDEDPAASESLLPGFGNKVILGFDPHGGLAELGNIKELPGLMLVDAQGIGRRVARPDNKEGWTALRATILNMTAQRK